MRSVAAPWVLCNGVPASVDDLRALALRNYGHFTVMQVRGRGVQGLALHLERLASATRELFGVTLEPARVREGLRAALDAASADDGTARITVFSRGFDIDDPARASDIDVLVSLTPPADASGPPLRVRSVAQPRALPHIKHLATLPQLHARRQARLAGFDDALLVDGQGRVCEGTLWNVGFWDGARVIWPEAPMLRGVTQQLLESGLGQGGIGQRSEPVPLDGLGRFRGAFATYSRGIHLLVQIDQTRFTPDPRLDRMLHDALAACPPDPV